VFVIAVELRRSLFLHAVKRCRERVTQAFPASGERETMRKLFGDKRDKRAELVSPAAPREVTEKGRGGGNDGEREEEEDARTSTWRRRNVVASARRRSRARLTAPRARDLRSHASSTTEYSQPAGAARRVGERPE